MFDFRAYAYALGKWGYRLTSDITNRSLVITEIKNTPEPGIAIAVVAQTYAELIAGLREAASIVPIGVFHTKVALILEILQDTHSYLLDHPGWPESLPGKWFDKPRSKPSFILK